MLGCHTGSSGLPAKTGFQVWEIALKMQSLVSETTFFALVSAQWSAGQPGS
jgi:hypothetical protein